MSKVGTRKVGTKVYVVRLSEHIEYQSKSIGFSSRVSEKNVSQNFEIFSTLKKAYEYSLSKMLLKGEFPKYDAVRYLIKQRSKFHKVFGDIEVSNISGYKGLMYESDDVDLPVSLDQVVIIEPKIIN